MKRHGTGFPLSDETISKIIHLHIDGNRSLDIAKALSISTATVSKYISRYKKEKAKEIHQRNAEIAYSMYMQGKSFEDIAAIMKMDKANVAKIVDRMIAKEKAKRRKNIETIKRYRLIPAQYGFTPFITEICMGWLLNRKGVQHG